MIMSAQEFVKLRTSALPEDYVRAATDGAAPEVWADVIQGFP
jgi:hypothetical protein